MRGTVSKDQLQFDPEIKKTARRNNAKIREAKRLARLAQPETSGSIPTPSGSVHTESPSGSPHSSAPSSPRPEPFIAMELENDEEPQNALPCWVSPRRLARLGNQNTRHVEMKSGIIHLLKTLSPVLIMKTHINISQISMVQPVHWE
jgi:hypothetical protein